MLRCIQIGTCLGRRRSAPVPMSSGPQKPRANQSAPPKRSPRPEKKPFSPTLPKNVPPPTPAPKASPAPSETPTHKPPPAGSHQPQPPPPPQPTKKSKRQGAFRSMAETAGAVAVGSTLGNLISSTLSELMHLFVRRQPEQGPCAKEIKEFMACTQANSNLKSCDELFKAMNECKRRNDEGEG